MTTSSPSPAAVVYADFSCPVCHLASLRVDGLLAAGHPVPDWRAVEHRPRLPVTGLRLEPSAQRTRDRELAAVALWADPDQLPTRAPGFLPHTGAAVAAYAEAYGAGVADLVRPLLFRAYWVEAQDIGDPEVLRHLLPGAFASGSRTSDPVRDFGYAVTSQRGAVTTAAYGRIREWQRSWLGLGAGIGLTLSEEWGTIVGAAVLDRLGAARVTVTAGRP